MLAAVQEFEGNTVVQRMESGKQRKREASEVLTQKGTGKCGGRKSTLESSPDPSRLVQRAKELAAKRRRSSAQARHHGRCAKYGWRSIAKDFHSEGLLGDGGEKEKKNKRPAPTTTVKRLMERIAAKGL